MIVRLGSDRDKTDGICGTFASELIGNSPIDVKFRNLSLCFLPYKTKTTWDVFIQHGKVLPCSGQPLPLWPECANNYPVTMR